MQIKKLELYTSNIEAQTDFYTNVLKLSIVEKTRTSVSFQIGNSILKFSYRETFTPYHYAINIPANQEQEAFQWLNERVEILKDGAQEIIDFEDWNAKAIYYYDKDNNIGEFIARKNLKNASEKAFDQNSLLEISEIGLPTTDISREYQLLSKTTNIPIYSGSVERFCAVGDENGLFIIINKNLKKQWYPTQDVPQSADFEIEFVEQGKNYTFAYENENLMIL